MKSLYLFGALCILLYFTVFVQNGLLNLDVMEVRNIVTAREMVSENNWLLPTMNGEVRIAKPPLPTWLTALPIMLTGSDDNLGALRIPAGAAACLMVFFVYFLARKLTSDPLIPFLSAAVTASSEFLIFMSKQASWDIFCHTFMLGAIWLLVSGWQREKQSPRIFIFAGILLALSFMSKGPVSFYSMLVPFLLSYIHVFGGRQVAQKWRGNILAVAVLVAIAMIWPCYVYLSLPDISVTVETREIQSWVFKQSKPLWYYLSFPVHSGIWTVLFLAALLYPLTHKQQPFWGENNNYKFLRLWIFWIVALLTLMPKKSTHYLLPIVAPASLMIGVYMTNLIVSFEERRQTFADRLVISIHEAVVVIFSFSCLVMYLYYIIDTNRAADIGSYLPPIIFAGIAGLSLHYYRLKNILNLFITTLVFVCFFCLFLPPVIAHMTHQRSFMALTESRKFTRGRDLPFYSSYEMNIKEVWAIGKNIEIIDINNLHSTQKPLAFFSKEPLDKLLQKNQMAEIRVQTAKSFVDTHTGETWYVSIIDKK